MFSESMVSISVPEGTDPVEKTSNWPAFVAVSSAWLVAMVRCTLGFVGHEALSFDLVLALALFTAMPLIVLRFHHATSVRHEWRSTRRPRLVLMSNH